MKRKRGRIPGLYRTIDRATAGPLFHGGVQDLTIGDLILPERETGVERAGPRFGGRSRADRVYVTPDVDAARVFAFLRGEGDVYEVEPLGPLEPDPDAQRRPGVSYQTTRARIVAVVTRRQKMEGGLTPIEAARLVVNQRRGS